MIQNPKLRAPIAMGVIAAFAASAWAANETLSTPSTTSPYHASAIEERPAISEAESVPASESLSPNETLVAREDAEAVPVVERSIQQPGITVEEQRLTEDQRIQLAVMDVLRSTPRLSGKIGVTSEDAVVTLSGYTSTAGQAWRAGRDAGRVHGVKYVVNEIRPRVGGIV